MTILRAREDHEPFENSVRNLLQPCQLNAHKKGHVTFKLFKNGNLYTIMEFNNKKVPQFNPLIGHRYKNCSNEILLPDSGSYCGVPASRFTLEHLFLMPQNVQDLDVGTTGMFS